MGAQQRTAPVSADRLREIAAHPLSLFVVDEAHCISSWGHDFRPDYLVLQEAVQRLGRPPVVALTATASPHTRAEIVDRLGLRDALTSVHSVDRPNIELRVVRHHETSDKRRAVLDEVSGLAGPGLVYVATPHGWETQAPVTHREWGPGIVMGAEPDRITVLFDTVGYKELSLRLAEEHDGQLVRGPGARRDEGP